MKIFIIISCLLLSSFSLSAQEKGKASYYANYFHNRKTASGETYDKNIISAAHRSLPFGTVVKVTNLKNKRSVKARINDRGPFIRGRIIDLSLAAAKEIGMIPSGVATVVVEVVADDKPVKTEEFFE